MVDIDSKLSKKIASIGFLCAILVILMHIPFATVDGTFLWWQRKILTGGITKIAVPFFFCFSGFFLAGHTSGDHWYKIEISKRVRSLLIPYFLWCVLGICMVVGMICTANVMHGRYLLTGISFPVVIKWFGLIPYALPQPGQLWFLRALMVLVFIYPLIRKVSTHLWFIALAFVFYAIVCPSGENISTRTGGFFRVFLSAEGLFYFSVGSYLRENAVAQIDRKWIVLAGMIGLLAFIGAALMIRHGLVGWVYLQFVGIPLVMVWVWEFWPSLEFPKWLTTLSFPIFLLHRFIIDPICVAFGNPCSVLTWWGLAILVTSGSMMAALFLRKIFPKMSGLLFGGR